MFEILPRKSVLLPARFLFVFPVPSAGHYTYPVEKSLRDIAFEVAVGVEELRRGRCDVIDFDNGGWMVEGCCCEGDEDRELDEEIGEGEHFGGLWLS